MVDTMITLFESTEKEFKVNGMGSLPDAITCEVTEERNGAFELEMSYPVTGKRYSDLSMRRIIFAKPNPYSDSQPFRIYAISKPINGIVTIDAEHISYDLSGVPVAPFRADAASNVFVKMKAAASVDCPFTFWTDKTTKATMNVAKPSSIRSLLGGAEGSVLDIYGGEYEFDKFTVKLHNNRGTNRGVSIRYGKNLTDLKQEENCSSVYTGVYPFWYSEDEGLVTLSEKIVEAEGTYDFTRIYPLDLSSEWQEKPAESDLRDRAKTYIKNNDIGIPKVSLDVSFVQLSQSEEYKHISLLEEVYLCDTVNVEFPELGVSATARCNKTVFDVLTNKYVKIELGDAKSNLASTIIEQSKNIAKIPTKNFLEQAIGRATQLITGGLGGYVIIHSSTGGKHPDEILIMDTDDIKTAKNVWRWNKGGLGYSNKGYEGPFETAITASGEIVANFITAGEFDGSLIKAGTVVADMLSIEYRNSVTKYADGAAKAMGDIVTKELTTLIENTADSIRLLCRAVEEHSMHNYVVGGDFSNGFTDEWYTSRSDNQVVTNSELGRCLLIKKTSSNISSYVRCNLGKLPAGTYRIRYKAATDTAHKKTARVQCTFSTSLITEAGLLKSNEFVTIEREVTISESSGNRYIYLYAYVTGAPVYVKDVEVLGTLSSYTETQLKLTTESIEAEVTRAKGIEDKLRASIKVNADNITSCVTKGSIGSYITQYYDKVIVAFNNSSKYVQINTGQISIYDNGVSASKRRSMFDENGNHFYRDNYYVGKIGTNQLASNNSHKGLVFDLEYQGKYMTWAMAQSPTANTYTTVLTYSRANSVYNKEGLHLGCNLYGNWHTLQDVKIGNISAGGYTAYTGTIPIITQISDNGDGSVSWKHSYLRVYNGIIAGYWV